MTIPQVQYAYFRIAVTILHELAHAANLLLVKDDGLDLFLEDETVAEEGFAYEN
jgi:hypothetical protein